MGNHDVILESARHLICDNAFNKVTVKMICEQSRISRKTFYTFYQDKYDVLEQILIKDVISVLNNLIDKFGKMELNRPIILEAMYQGIYENKVFYRKTINLQGKDSLESYLLYNLIKSMQKILVDSRIGKIEREYVCYFYASAQVMLIKKWIMDDFILTPREMAENYQKWAVETLFSYYL